MKILLIQPKMTKRPMDTDLKTRMSPPLSLLTLAGLTPAEHDVVLLNENVEKIRYDAGADLVGITITLDVFPRAVRIAAKFHELGVPVVAGGIHVTCRPEDCLPHFDALCVGPAERVWARIIDDAAAGRLYQTSTGKRTHNDNIAELFGHVADGTADYACRIYNNAEDVRGVDGTADRPCRVYDGAEDVRGVDGTADHSCRVYDGAESFRDADGTVDHPCSFYDWAEGVRDVDGTVDRPCRVYDGAEGFKGRDIASPAYDRVDPRKYLYSNVVFTSRGCPNRCGFCYNSCENRMYVRRPISDVLNDIRSLKTRHIFFIDDNFIGDPAYTRELLLALRDMRIVWNAAVTTKIADRPDLLDLMAETGCRSLFIGFESINAASLESVHKDNIVKKYESLVEAIHSRGIMINASMVFGLDGDDAGTFSRTLNWLIKMRVETLTSHILTPYPGTELYRSMDAAGRITERDLSKYNTANVVFQPAGMTQSELYQGYRRIYRQFYSLKNIARRLPLCKKQRAPYILFNLFYRKFGRFTSAVSRAVPMSVLGRLAARISYKV